MQAFERKLGLRRLREHFAQCFGMSMELLALPDDLVTPFGADADTSLLFGSGAAHEHPILLQGQLTGFPADAQRGFCSH
jgi:hypothetical protein